MSLRVLLGAAGSLVALGVVAGLVGLLGATEPRELEIPAVAAYAAAPVAAERPAPAPAGTGPSVAPAWVARTAARVGIPEPAVRAYAVAQLRVSPGCDLGWTTLAGIGWIESHHGTLGGRTLLADGRSSTAIIGPALDGAGPVAAIPASPESALLHTDATWDHAVGPMQFVTDTWTRWASDGDGDGASDPYDIDDAAYAAARYLCASGTDLTTGAGWARAVLSYNHAQSYVDAVHAAATAYAAR